MLSLLIILAGSWLLGAWALRPFRLPRGAGLPFYSLVGGLCLAAVATLVVGSVSLRTSQLLLTAIALAGLAWGFRTRLRAPALQFDASGPREDADPGASPRVVVPLSVAALVGALALTFLGALAPVTGWDATSAHIALPQDYAREGRILLIEGTEYSAYPHLVHCLYAQAYFGGGERAVTLLNWCWAVLTCGGMFYLGKGVYGRRCGIIAAAIMATSPVFFDQGGAVSIDLAFCCLTVSALAALMTWLDERRPGWLLLAALLAGSSCGIRHTGYLTCALMTAGVVLGAPERRVRATALFAAASAMAALPWLARSAWLVGNPFYPFFASWLGGDTFAHWEVTGLGMHVSIKDQTGLLDLLRFPWDIVMRPQRFDGWSKSPGGLVLFLGIPGLIVGTRRTRALGAFTGVGFVAFFYFQRLARYLLPFFAPMMVAAAVASCRLKALRYAAAVALVASFVYGLGLDGAALHFKLPVVLGLESREAYLESRIERYPAFVWINKNVPDHETVLLFERRSYFIQGRTWQNDEPLKPLAGRPVDEQAAWLNAHGIKWVYMPLTYMEESPGYRGLLLDMANLWRRTGRFFRAAKTFDLVNPRTGATERVEVYEVLHE